MIAWGVPVSTACLSYALARRIGPAARSTLWQAFEITLEYIGAAFVFLCLNLVLGVAIVLALRWLTPWFVSLYQVTDVVLVLLSVLQGVVFQTWWRSARYSG